jgi:hypothetical protein
VDRSPQIIRKVPTITAHFWAVKILTTAMGEAFSDYLAIVDFEGRSRARECPARGGRALSGPCPDGAFRRLGEGLCLGAIVSGFGPDGRIKPRLRRRSLMARAQDSLYG